MKDEGGCIAYHLRAGLIRRLREWIFLDCCDVHILLLLSKVCAATAAHRHTVVMPLTGMCHASMVYTARISCPIADITQAYRRCLCPDAINQQPRLGVLPVSVSCR